MTDSTAAATAPVYRTPCIVKGFQLTLTAAEACTGQTLSPRVFDWLPTGARLLICKDTIPEKIGLIELPQAARDNVAPGSGWIIAVGPEAGLTHLMPIGNLIAHDGQPTNLLGLHVSFMFSAGKALRFTLHDGEYDSAVALYHPADILMVDYNSDPLEADKRALDNYVDVQTEALGTAEEAVKQRERDWESVTDEPSASLIIPSSKD